MNVVVVIDSFKGSLSSLEAGNAVSEGIRKVYPKAEISVRPLADGGEGTVEALTLGMKGRLETITVTGPVGMPVEAQYGILSETRTGIVEMSAAAGITLVEREKRNPLHTTTYGVGEILKDAILKGCRNFIVGIGGSATNDGGIGMLQALGFGILSKDGTPVSFGAKGLQEIAAITDDKVIPELKECSFQIACDVTNPLCGKNGCSVVFGPQKGATADMIEDMDQWLNEFAKLVKKKYPKADCNIPGTGAAGGLGFAFLSFMNATLKSGVEIVLQETELEKYIQNADVVITGEGRLDAQTVMGKAPIGVARIAKKHGRKVIAFSGCASQDASVCNDYGIDAFFPILQEVVPLEKAMESQYAHQNLTETAKQVFRLLSTFCKEDGKL